MMAGTKDCLLRNGTVPEHWPLRCNWGRAQGSNRKRKEEAVVAVAVVVTLTFGSEAQCRPVPVHAHVWTGVFLLVHTQLWGYWVRGWRL